MQDARDKTDLVRSIRGDEGGGGTAEVMQTHGFPELGAGAGADDVVDAARGKRTALERRPKAVMAVAADEAGTDFQKIALKIGEKFFWNPEALRLALSE